MSYSPRSIITPVINTSIYAAGDIVGGLLSFPNCFGRPHTGVLKDIFIKDSGNENVAMSLYLFNAQPTGTYTNNAAFSWGSSADFAKCIGRIDIASADYVTLNSRSTYRQELCQQVNNVEDTEILYGILVLAAAQTPTWAVGDLEIQLGFLRDDSGSDG